MGRCLEIFAATPMPRLLCCTRMTQWQGRALLRRPQTTMHWMPTPKRWWVRSSMSARRWSVFMSAEQLRLLALAAVPALEWS